MLICRYAAGPLLFAMIIFRHYFAIIFRCHTLSPPYYFTCTAIIFAIIDITCQLYALLIRFRFTPHDAYAARH